MTQGYTLSTQSIKDAFVAGRLGLYTEIPAEAITRNEENFDSWLAAHDAQIRAEALELTDEERRLIIDVFNTDPYLEHLGAGNAIQDYDERQAYHEHHFNRTLLGLFPMIVEHRKEQIEGGRK